MLISPEAKMAATEIFDDLCDRRGIKHEIRQCDFQVQREIRTAHAKIIQRAIDAATSRMKKPRF